MNIMQIVDIPADHKLTVEVPHEVPTGPAIIVFKPTIEAPSPLDPTEAVRRCTGITKRLGIRLSGDDFLTMRRQDKELEDRLDSLNGEQTHSL